MGYLVRGLRLWVTSPRLMLLGALPALVVGLFFATALVLFAINLESLATLITPFADRWVDPLRAGTRIAAGTALGAVTMLLAVYTFVAVTLTLGNPFYERIWRAVEQRMGDAPVEIDEPFWRSATRGIGSGIRLFALTATVGLSLFAVSFIPIVGQTAVPVLGALLGGWFLTLELTGFAFDARGLRLRDRRRMLGARRASTLGFGVLTYVLFLVPLGAVVIMPAAVAGATMLSRDALASASRQANPATS
ncbi:EI24 domain-containing protein [Marisediminicola antarctica]